MYCTINNEYAFFLKSLDNFLGICFLRIVKPALPTRLTFWRQNEMIVRSLQGPARPDRPFEDRCGLLLPFFGFAHTKKYAFHPSQGWVHGRGRGRNSPRPDQPVTGGGGLHAARLSLPGPADPQREQRRTRDFLQVWHTGPCLDWSLDPSDH